MTAASFGVTVTATAAKQTTTCNACGETLAEMNILLPEPYAWLDTAGGTLVSNFDVGKDGEFGSITPQQIPNTNQYGLRLDYDWSGFWMGGELLKNVPQGQSVTMAIQYYTTKEFSAAENYQLFRYVTADGYPQTDLFTAHQHLVGHQRALVFHTFTAEELADLRNKDFKFYVLGCESGAEQVYIQSVKLVNTEYVHAVDYTDPYCAFVNFKGQAPCEYYPDVTPIYGFDTSWGVYEQQEGFEGYMYVRVHGEEMGDEQNRNKPILLKVYASEGYENSRLRLDAVDMSDEEGNFYWGTIPKTYFVNGVATVMVNACLKNRLNGLGSIRVLMQELPAIARIEVYDVETYCQTPVTDAAREAMHEAMSEWGMNITVKGRTEPTDNENGYTGDVYCATCERLIKHGKKIPALLHNGLPTPYVWFDTVDGEVYGNVELQDSGVHPAATRIDDEHGYGIELTGDWQGFHAAGKLFANVPKGQSVTLILEYYVAEGRLSDQIFRFMPAPNVLADGTLSEDGQWIDCFTEGVNGPGWNVLKMQETALVTYTYSTAQVDALREREFAIGVRGCHGGTDCAYIKSMRVVNSEHVWETGGLDRADYETTPHSGYYPHILLQKNSGITAVPVTDGITLEGELNCYVYAALTYSLLREGEENCSVAVRFTFRRDSTIMAFDWQYQIARAAEDEFSARFKTIHSTVQNGVAEIVLEDAAFTNGIHSTGSLRVPNTASCPVWDSLLRVEISRVHDRRTINARIQAADDVLNGTVPASRTAFEAALVEAKAVADDLFATERAIADAVVRLDAAAARLVACEHAAGTALQGYRAATCFEAGYTGDDVCRECNGVVKGGRGHAIPAHEKVVKNAQAAACDAAGYTGDLFCTVCQTVVKRGNTIPPLPHRWDGGWITAKPTASQAGEITYLCLDCGAVKKEAFTPDTVYGDVDKSGRIDSTDARLVLQYAVGKIEEAALDTAAADVNGDNKIDSTDARLVLQFAVGKIQEFA